MVSLEKIAHLAEDSKFDSLGQVPNRLNDVNLSKVRALGEGTKHDVCASTASNRNVKSSTRIGNVASCGICHSFTPDGRCVSLFKTLFTNKCSQQCSYCPNSTDCDSKSKTYSYTPEELANIVITLYRSNYIEGLFLSSGTGRDEDILMEKIVETARLLREDYHFQGYMHLKVLPGADKDYIKQCMKYADRLSINIETTSSTRLQEVSPTKDYKYDILRRQRYIRDMKNRLGLPSGHTTQMVVGGAGENDKEIFESMLREYRRMKVKRAYYSAFIPVQGTRFEDKPDQPQWREHKLYQTDWLFRVYDLAPHEINLAFDEDGYLPNSDPKVTIARQILDQPIDPNEADHDTLLRVPGIGPTSANRIVSRREENPIKKRRELSNLGVVMKRARPFLEVNGWTDTTLERWWN